MTCPREWLGEWSLGFRLQPHRLRSVALRFPGSPLCSPCRGRFTTDGAHFTHQSVPAPSLSARILAHWVVNVPTCRPALPLELFLLSHAYDAGAAGPR